MRKLWLVAKHEYLTVVKAKSFLVGTLGLPILIITVMVVAVVVALGGRGPLPVGYVDHSGVLSAVTEVARNDPSASVQFQAFPDEATGLEALNAEAVQALYVLPQDYLTNHEVTLYYLVDEPGALIQEDFNDLLRGQLLAQQPVEIRERILGQQQFTIRSADRSRAFETQNPLNFVVPYAAAFFFIFAVMNSAGYMLQAITKEKENRTMELLATSIRPLELIGGKAVGLMGVGVSQLVLWLGTALAAIIVARPFIEGMGAATLPWSALGIVAVFFLPAYALISAMMTAIGSAVEDLRQGQQISGILNLFFMLPFFLIVLIMTKPNSPIVIALTLFPTTAFVTIAFRWGMSQIPLWQLVVSWLLLVVSAGVSLWVAARIFKVGMLSYGQRLSLRKIVQALRD